MAMEMFIGMNRRKPMGVMTDEANSWLGKGVGR